MSKKQDFIIKHIWWIFTLWLILIGLSIILIQDFFDSKEKNALDKIEFSKQEYVNGTKEERENCLKKIKYWPDARIWICYNSNYVWSFNKLINIWWNLVEWAWWSKDLDYMIINLNRTNYHYCWFTRLDWIDFSKSKNKDSFYIEKIKWNFDCRNWWLPLFCDTNECREKNSRYISTERSFSFN